MLIRHRADFIIGLLRPRWAQRWGTIPSARSSTGERDYPLLYQTWGMAAAMKNYKCIFDHGNGRTTISVSAANAEQAFQNARETVLDRSATVEIWDETGLVLKKGAGPPQVELTQRAS